MNVKCILLFEGAKHGYIADVFSLHGDRWDSGKITLYVKGSIKTYDTARKIRKRMRELADGKK